MSVVRIRIHPDNQLRIVKAVKAFMENEEISGEVKLDFTNHYGYDTSRGEGTGGFSFIEGTGIVQYPVHK